MMSIYATTQWNSPDNSVVSHAKTGHSPGKSDDGIVGTGKYVDFYPVTICCSQSKCTEWLQAPQRDPTGIYEGMIELNEELKQGLNCMPCTPLATHNIYFDTADIHIHLASLLDEVSSK